jgi:LEA14-like dessication related protein
MLIDDNVYTQIIKSVNKIDGDIISVMHPNGTNTVEVSAKWDESEFDNKIKEIQKIDNVKDIRIYKKNKLAVRTISESITLSDSVSWNLEKEPVG